MIVPKIWCPFLIAVLVGNGLTIADKEFNKTEDGVTIQNTNGFDDYYIRKMKDLDSANKNEEEQYLPEFSTTKQDAEMKFFDDDDNNEEVNEYATTDVSTMRIKQDLGEFWTAKQDAEIKYYDDDGKNEEFYEYTTTDVSTIRIKQDLGEFWTVKQDAEIRYYDDDDKNEDINEYTTTDVSRMSTKQDLGEFLIAEQDAEIKDLDDDGKNEDVNEYTIADVSTKQYLADVSTEKQYAGSAHFQNGSAVFSTLLSHVLRQKNDFKPGMFPIDKEMKTTEPNVDDTSTNFTNSTETTLSPPLTESSVRVPADTSFTVLPVKTGTALDDIYLDNIDGFEFINLDSITPSEPTNLNTLLSTYVYSDDLTTEAGVSTTSITPQLPEYVEMDKPFPFLESIEEFDKTAEEIFAEDYYNYPTFKEGLFETWLEERRIIEDEEAQTESRLIDVPESSSYVHAKLLDEANTPCLALNVTYKIFLNCSEIKLPIQYAAITQYKDNQGSIEFDSGDDSGNNKISVVFDLSCTKDYCHIIGMGVSVHSSEENIDIKCEQTDLSLFKTDYGFASENEEALIYAMNNELVFQIDHAKLHVMQRCASEDDFRLAFPILYYKEILGGTSVVLILGVFATYVAIKANRRKKLIIGS